MSQPKGRQTAAEQICKRLRLRGVECVESSPGVFNINKGKFYLTYFGNGKCVFRYPSVHSVSFNSTSTSEIVEVVSGLVQVFGNLLVKDISLLSSEDDDNSASSEKDT